MEIGCLSLLGYFHEPIYEVNGKATIESMIGKWLYLLRANEAR